MKRYQPEDLRRALVDNPDLALRDADALQDPPPRKMGARNLREREMQFVICAEAEWRALEDERWKLLFSIPNGQYRRGQIPEPGIQAGVPDLFLPVARPALGNHPAYHGLFLELKIKPNRPSAHQEWWLAALRAQGYCALVVYDHVETALLVLQWYLSREDVLPDESH